MRQKVGFTHGIPAGTLTCARRSVSRTASRRSPSRAPEAPFHARHPAGVPSVRQKPCFTHGIPVGDPPVRQKPRSTHGIPAGILPCARSPVPRTVSLRSPFCASKALFHARHPAGVPPVRQKPCFTHGIPVGAPPVRQKVGFTHDIPPESLLCVRRSVPRTVSLPETFRAPEAPFHARHPCRRPSVRQKPRSTHGGCPRRLTSAGRRVDIQKKFFCFLASAHVSFLYLRLLCILLRL